MTSCTCNTGDTGTFSGKARLLMLALIFAACAVTTAAPSAVHAETIHGIAFYFWNTEYYPDESLTVNPTGSLFIV
jgi:hypothetical protein